MQSENNQWRNMAGNNVSNQRINESSMLAKMAYQYQCHGGGENNQLAKWQ